MKKFTCTGIGELLWDMLPAGRQLGGAPGNFAYHASALGGEGRIISRVGADQNGRDILDRLRQLRLPSDCVQIDSKAPTSTVSVELTDDRSAKYVIHENVAWDFLAADDAARSAAVTSDAICFGSLAQRSGFARIGIRQLLDAASRDCLCIFDINLRQNYFSKEIIDQSLARATILKINDQELPVLAKLFSLTGDARRQLQQIIDRYALRGAAFTRGDRGSALLIDGEWSDHAGLSIQVVDTVGAGDSFTAAMTLGLLFGWPLDLLHERAARVAAYVCSQAGATPTLPDELRAPFMNAAR